MKMKYKIGTRVMIREWNDMAEEYGIDSDGDITVGRLEDGKVFFGDTKDFCGKLGTIIKDELDGYYVIRTDSDYNEIFLSPYFFYEVEEEMKVCNDKKFKLEDGMVIETMNGHRYLVWKDIFINESGYMLKSNFTDELRLRRELNSPFLDINKVYMVLNPCRMENFFEDRHLALIWERKESKKLTKKQLEDMLGYEIEIVEE